MTQKKLIYFVTEDWYFLSHRLPMARAAKAAGFDVSVIANIGTKREAIEAEGVRVIPFPLKRKSLNPLTALRQVYDLTRIYWREKPDLVHHIALKPILFGSMAAWLAGVPYVLNAFAGLGVIFETDIVLAKILRPMLVAFFYVLFKRRGFWTLFQNADDRDRLLALRLCDPARSVIIRGSGVEVERYAVAPFPPLPPFICVMAGRMIEAKGLSVLKQVFARLEKEHPDIQLWLCGRPDADNPGSWTEETLRIWCANSTNVIWKGYQDDMSAIWAQAHLALQPSLGGEGLPKSLLEAGACGRAMVASDVPGCREVVEDGRNGYLVPRGDASMLARAIVKLAVDPAVCAAMGRESRRMVEGDLSARAVEDAAARLYRRILRNDY